MRKTNMYKYIGLNGTILSHILLEDAIFIPYTKLTADEGCILTNGTRRATSIIVNELDISNWKEIVIEK